MSRKKTFNVRVTDTVTYKRTKIVEVKALDEDAAKDAAIELALNGPGSFFADMQEEQTDCEPWEAEVVK